MSRPKFSWPRKGDKAFASADDGTCFHLPSLTRLFPRHAEAFKTAAEMVIDGCEELQRHPLNDELFLPVAYLYRHCLELQLKSLIRVGTELHFFKRSEVDEALAGHNLAKLWSRAKKLLIDRWPTADQTPLKAVEAVVQEFHQADPNGQVFRYHADKQG